MSLGLLKLKCTWSAWSCYSNSAILPISEILIPVPYTLAIYRNYNLNSILYTAQAVLAIEDINIPQYYIYNYNIDINIVAIKKENGFNHDKHNGSKAGSRRK